MIIYNVTTSVERAVHEQWLVWMRHTHIPAVMDTGLILEHRFLRVLADDGNDSLTFAVQFTLADMAAYETYEREHAPRLRAESEKYYGGRALSVRTLLEVIPGA